MKPGLNISLNPWQYMMLSFAVLIAMGSLLLSLPYVHHDSGLHFLDALFTSTSAVCVTGLVTVPTSGFNAPGQWTILLLIQAGAIGIMTLTTSFLLALKGRVSLKHRSVFSRLQDNYSLLDAHGVLRNILRITFWTEFAGFVLLSIGFRWEGLRWKAALYQGFFHSVSAYCNAGFSTYDESLTGMNPLIKYTVALLIIMGGIGYIVVYEVLERLKNGRKFSLHSKIVILTTIALIVLGTLLFYLLEGGKIGWTDSFFQSVTTRTAGFNSVDMSVLHPATVYVLTVLMFIGASPGSTGGGIKTTTFFTIIYSIFQVLKGKKQIVVFQRSISYSYVIRAFATAILYFMIISVGTVIILETNDVEWDKTLFEAVSAMGTVGLSLGITPELNATGKVVLILLMYIGRIGPASLALAFMLKQKDVHLNYPEAELY